MRIACSSASFDDALATGALTQLEWLDRCANAFDLDGVIFDARHFARTDVEYLAQLKKTASDLGLSVAGVACDVATDAGFWLDVARTIGAPLVVAQAAPAGEADAWSTFVEGLSALAGEAKRVNVPLAVRPVAGTLCANASDLRRLAKDIDSAWLRFALDFDTLERDDRAALALKAIIAYVRETSPEQILELRAYRGFMVVEGPAQAQHAGEFAHIVAHLRRAHARSVLAHEGEPVAT